MQRPDMVTLERTSPSAPASVEENKPSRVLRNIMLGVSLAALAITGCEDKTKVAELESELEQLERERNNGLTTKEMLGAKIHQQVDCHEERLNTLIQAGLLNPSFFKKVNDKDFSSLR